jgi:hypothetical protein
MRKKKSRCLVACRYKLPARFRPTTQFSIYSSLPCKDKNRERSSCLARLQVQFASKFGITAGGISGKPEYVKQTLNGSLERLKVAYVDLYYQHRIDPNTPIEVADYQFCPGTYLLV